MNERLKGPLLLSKNTVPTFPEMKLPAGAGGPHDIYCFFLAGEISESINLGLGVGGGGEGEEGSRVFSLASKN